MPRFIRFFRAGCFSLGAATLALSGCSGADLLNATVSHSGYHIVRDCVYGDAPRQALDIYIPDHLAQPAGVIVFFYGGRWEHGSKDMYRFVGQAFASHGFITVVPDYRLYPEVKFPAFVEDGAAAVVWAHRHSADYGGDPARLFVAGHSAGAYIAAMLALDTPYMRAAGGARSWIRGMVGLAGPYDFLPFTDADIADIFGTAPAVATQPITYAHTGAPPLLLLTGDADTDVRPANTAHLAAALRRAGSPVEERIYPGVAHLGIVLALAEGFRGKAPVLEDMDRFIQAHAF